MDGRAITDPLRRVVPERIDVAIDGVHGATAAPLTIALYKPRGYVTTRSDPEGRKTVYDLLAGLDVPVVPVGRLDLATSGLLLFTNDTQFANWLTDPSSAIPRIYLVTARGRIDEALRDQLVGGITSNDEQLHAADVVIRKASTRETHLTVTLTEGKNREVRRLFEAIGHPVTQLRRVQFGGLALGALAPGAWRPVPDDELRAAFPGYQPRARRRNPSSTRSRPHPASGTSKNR